jgi:hypothetical protein
MGEWHGHVASMEETNNAVTYLGVCVTYRRVLD